MHIKFNGAVGKTKFAILEERDIAIIGMKTMDDFGIDISPRNKTLCSNGQCTAFLEGISTVSSVKIVKPNVFLSHNELIPPNTHKIVHVYLKGEPPVTENCIVEMEYAESRYGLLFPSVVTKRAQKYQSMFITI